MPYNMQQMSTLECLRDFSAKNHLVRPNVDQLKQRNGIADLLGIFHSTGRKWFTNFVLPKGTNLIRLQIFLELCGYVPSERFVLQPFMRKLSDALGLSRMPLQQISELADADPTSMMRWALGEVRPNKTFEKNLPVLLEMLEKSVESVRQEWIEKIKSLNLETVKVRGAPYNNGVAKESVVSTLADLICHAEPLARRLVSDEFNSEDRRRLREITSTDDRSHLVFQLSNHLNRLCGEKARDVLQQTATSNSTAK